MRPVDKGAAPADYAHYKDAKVDLIARIGDYCSYCERQVETHLAVEHVEPQVERGELENSWDNFLLSCVNCNSSKGRTDVDRYDYFWPDRDNTLRAFEYLNGGLVRPNASLGAADRARARDTIALTGLDKFPTNAGREPTASDHRWRKRMQTWQLAERGRARIADQDTDAVRELVVENATARGMFSIWWTVFACDVDMRRRLREAFIGTHAGSFDADEDAIRRPGGRL